MGEAILGLVPDRILGFHELGYGQQKQSQHYRDSNLRLFLLGNPSRFYRDLRCNHLLGNRCKPPGIGSPQGVQHQLPPWRG